MMMNNHKKRKKEILKLKHQTKKIRFIVLRPRRRRIPKKHTKPKKHKQNKRSNLIKSKSKSNKYKRQIINKLQTTITNGARQASASGNNAQFAATCRCRLCTTSALNYTHKDLEILPKHQIKQSFTHKNYILLLQTRCTSIHLAHLLSHECYTMLGVCVF